MEAEAPARRYDERALVERFAGSHMRERQDASCLAHCRAASLGTGQLTASLSTASLGLGRPLPHDAGPAAASLLEDVLRRDREQHARPSLEKETLPRAISFGEV